MTIFGAVSWSQTHLVLLSAHFPSSCRGSPLPRSCCWPECVGRLCRTLARPRQGKNVATSFSMALVTCISNGFQGLAEVASGLLTQSHFQPVMRELPWDSQCEQAGCGGCQVRPEVDLNVRGDDFPSQPQC